MTLDSPPIFFVERSLLRTYTSDAGSSPTKTTAKPGCLPTLVNSSTCGTKLSLISLAMAFPSIIFADMVIPLIFLLCPYLDTYLAIPSLIIHLIIAIEQHLRVRYPKILRNARNSPFSAKFQPLLHLLRRKRNEGLK